MSLNVSAPSSNLLLTDQEFQQLSHEDQEHYILLLKLRLAELKQKKLLAYLPNPKQETFHKNGAHVRAVLGGNRSGKTTCGVVEFLWHMTGQYPDWYPKENRYNRAVKGRIFCEDFSKHGAQVIVPAIDEWLDMSLVAKQKNNPVGFPIFWKLKNGSSFEILTYEQKTASYEGWKGDVAWFDEPPPRDKYIATLRGLVDTGGRAWLTLTPLSQPWLFDEIVNNTDKKRTFALTMDIRDNLIREEKGILYGHLTEKAIAQFEANLKPDEKESRLHGKFLHLTGLVYKQFNPTTHVVDHVDIKPHWTRWMAIDPHPHTPAAVLWLAVDEHENYWIYDELWLKDMDAKEVANAIKAQEGANPANFRYIDPAMDKDNELAGGFNIRKELMKYGIYTIRANNDWDFGKDMVDQALTPKWLPMAGQEMPRLKVVGPNCPRFLYEMTHYVWEYKQRSVDSKTRQRPIKKDDHLMDCMRYILAAQPRYIQAEREEEETVSYKGDFVKYAAKPTASRGYHSLVDRDE